MKLFTKVQSYWRKFPGTQIRWWYCINNCFSEIENAIYIQICICLCWSQGMNIEFTVRIDKPKLNRLQPSTKKRDHIKVDSYWNHLISHSPISARRTSPYSDSGVIEYCHINSALYVLRIPGQSFLLRYQAYMEIDVNSRWMGN